MDLGPAREPIEANLNMLPEVTWIQPIPDSLVLAGGDPADTLVARESIRLAFIAALQHLPPKQRAALILCEVLRWQASEVAELLETIGCVGEQRAAARARDARGWRVTADEAAQLPLDDASRALLARYVSAFENYDMQALTSLIQEDATQSMPPFDLWLRGRDDILTWWFGPGIGCRGSRLVPTVAANGAPAFGQYKPAPAGGYEPWALQVIELAGRADRRVHVLPRHRRRFSRSSACPCGSTRNTSLKPASAIRPMSSAEASRRVSRIPCRNAPSCSRASTSTVPTSGAAIAPASQRIVLCRRTAMCL